MLGYIKINNKHTANADDDANTVISIATMYDLNASNGNGGDRNVLYLTGNSQVIEENHIGQNMRKNYVPMLNAIMVWMVDNMPKKNCLLWSTRKDKRKVHKSSKWYKN